MPKDYESNWDDLARQLGFEPPEDSEESGEAFDTDMEDIGPAESDEGAAAKEEDDAKESIADFFGDADQDAAETKESSTEDVEATQDDANDDGEVESTESAPRASGRGDHWGSLAGSLGLEESEASAEPSDAEPSVTEPSVTEPADNVLSDMFVPNMEPAEEVDKKDSAAAVESDSTTDAQAAGAESPAQVDEDGVETIEFDVQDLTDEDDDRPRRRRKKRRRRRAVIEELREELEREKEEEAAVEPVDEVNESVEVESTSDSESDQGTGRRRRRRRDRGGQRDGSDKPRSRRPRSEDLESDADADAKDSNDDEGSQEERSRDKVSKNQRRRRKRERSDSGSDESNGRQGESGEAKPERKFPTWEEAIRPVVEGNMERTEKPQRRRRPRKSRDA